MRDDATAQPQLVKGIQAEYVRSEYDGRNTSGMRVFGVHVLIKPDQCAAVTSGGVHMIDERIERMNAASISGAIFALGDNAFMHHADGTPWKGRKPAVGDRIYFTQYAGAMVPGRDGALYRIVEDGCIEALMLDEDEGTE